MGSLINFVKRVFRFVWHFFLFILAWVLMPPLTLINYAIVRSDGYFLSTAASIDIWANREFRTLWNATLIKKGGYHFGLQGETISSVLGKNKRDNTLSKTGKILANILDKIDKNHCYKSINFDLNW